MLRQRYVGRTPGTASNLFRGIAKMDGRSTSVMTHASGGLGFRVSGLGFRVFRVAGFLEVLGLRMSRLEGFRVAKKWKSVGFCNCLGCDSFCVGCRTSPLRTCSRDSFYLVAQWYPLPFFLVTSSLIK